MAAVTICSDFRDQENKFCHCFLCFPMAQCHEVIGQDAVIFAFWMLSFKPAFSLSSFTFIKMFFSSSSLSTVRMVSSTYLLIFLLATVIPACASSSPAFLMMFSANKLNKQGDNIWYWCTPCPIWSQPIVTSSSNCCFLTCTQISQETGKVVCYSHFFQNFPQFVVIHTVEGFRLINEVEVDVFLEFSCFFNDPVDVGNLIYGFSAFSKSSLNILKFSVQVLLKPSLETFFFFFFSITLLSCEMSAIVQYFEHSLA